MIGLRCSMTAALIVLGYIAVIVSLCLIVEVFGK